MESFEFNLVTPEAKFFSGASILVEAPGEEGDFGVLAGHEPLIAALKAGVVKIHDEKDEVSRVFISSGVAEVNYSSCTILAERVIELDNLSKEQAEINLAKSKDKLAHAFDETAKFDTKVEVEIAEAIAAAV